MVKNLGINNKAVVEEKESNETIEEKQEIKEEEIKEEPTYEIPEELSKDAPFRKSKYVVDDDEGEE